MLGRLIDIARVRGVARLEGEVLAHNQAMRALAVSLGGRIESHPDPRMVRATRNL